MMSHEYANVQADLMIRMWLCMYTYCASVVARTPTMAAAPLIRVFSKLGIRKAAINIVNTDLVCRILEQLCPSHPKQEDEDQQQKHH